MKLNNLSSELKSQYQEALKTVSNSRAIMLEKTYEIDGLSADTKTVVKVMMKYSFDNDEVGSPGAERSWRASASVMPYNRAVEKVVQEFFERKSLNPIHLNEPYFRRNPYFKSYTIN